MAPFPTLVVALAFQDLGARSGHRSKARVVQGGPLPVLPVPFPLLQVMPRAPVHATTSCWGVAVVVTTRWGRIALETPPVNLALVHAHDGTLRPVHARVRRSREDLGVATASW